MPTSHLIHRTWPPRTPTAVGAEGCVVRTADGREYLDATSGALAVTVGYGIPGIMAAVQEQAGTLPFAHSARFVSGIAESAAEELTAELPGEGPQALRRVMFTTGGSESIELAAALAYRAQVARGRPDRQIILSRHLSYHGCTFATLGLGGRVALRSLAPLGSVAIPHLPPAYPYRPEWHRRFPGEVNGIPGVDSVLPEPLSEEQLERARRHPAEALEVTLEAMGPDRVCAFLGEPIVGASAGAIVPPDDYWPRVREICDRHEVAWIADEVMTGMGRTGAWMACEHWGVVPDVVALGKGLTAGYAPGGAVVAREEVWQAAASVKPGFPLGFTFAQHPLTAAAARAVVRHVREHDLLAVTRRLEERLRAALVASLGEHPRCGEIRGRGAMIGVEIVADRDSREPYPRDADATGRALGAAAEAGVLFYPSRGGYDGVRGDAFLVAPPLVAGEDDVARIGSAARAGLDALS